MNHPISEKIKNVFEARGNDNYGVEKVTQLQHACQCGSLAISTNKDDELILSAFLHDIGHILSDDSLPSNLQNNLDDLHEERGYQFLKKYFSERVTDPIRLHVAAKRYLCTKNEYYAKNLSPTSYESYMDQGGPMSEDELKEFEAERYYQEAVLVRQWDDQAKVEGRAPLGLSFFIEKIERFLDTKEN